MCAQLLSAVAAAVMAMTPYCVVFAGLMVTASLAAPRVLHLHGLALALHYEVIRLEGRQAKTVS